MAWPKQTYNHFPDEFLGSTRPKVVTGL